MKVNFNTELCKAIAARCPLTPVQYMLVKRLDTTFVKVKKDLADPTNPKNEGLQPGDNGYVYKRVTEKEPAMFQKGVIIKLDMQTANSQKYEKPEEGRMALPYKVGDVIVFHERACMALDILPELIMVRPYDVQGVWDTDVELGNNASEKVAKKKLSEEEQLHDIIDDNFKS
jgi:ubiquitin